jgi:hypothetical protein
MKPLSPGAVSGPGSAVAEFQIADDIRHSEQVYES